MAENILIDTPICMMLYCSATSEEGNQEDDGAKDDDEDGRVGVVVPKEVQIPADVEIYPGFALIGRDPSRLCSHWLDLDVANASFLMPYRLGGISQCLYGIGMNV